MHAVSRRAGMPTSDHYSWDFDRPPAQWMERYSTFSVGIFQWLKKASGRGLKQSRAICRVMGYTAEPDRVYDKALEICARLNRESASAAHPPSWLQKQYSVPRPAGTVVRQKSDDFTAAQVRAARLKVMKDRLLPAGFVVGKNASYVRRHGDQVHFINFQGSKYGHEFTVNLGFHYTFIPPLFRQRSLPLAELHLLDCIAQERIGYFLPEKHDTWFKYGDDRDVLIDELRLCATTCLNVFREHSERWRDSSDLLRDLAAESGSPWRRHDDLALGWLELRTGQVAAAETRLAAWSDHHSYKPPAVYVRLQELIQQYRELDAREVKQVEWRTWVA